MIFRAANTNKKKTEQIINGKNGFYAVACTMHKVGSLETQFPCVPRTQKLGAYVAKVRVCDYIFNLM